MAKYGPTPRPIEERFWEKVDRRGPDDCWPWTAAKHTNGYGAFHLNQRQRAAQAHRVAWELTYGLVPDGLWVLHRCDNPPCCNPADLFLGTPTDNQVDMVQKGRHGRHVCPDRNARGERHGRAKLTLVLVAEIRERHRATGCTKQSLADLYGVHRSTIQRILVGHYWKADAGE